MERVIKFRVWNLEDKQWDNPAILEVWNESGKLEPFSFIKTGKLNPVYTPLENYVIQQFTGLSDKNEKEIYEGDIIKYPQDSNRLGYFDTMIVEWDIEYDGFGGLNCGFRLGGDYATKDNVEIIGNIFENSELLK